MRKHLSRTCGVLGLAVLAALLGHALSTAPADARGAAGGTTSAQDLIVLPFYPIGGGGNEEYMLVVDPAAHALIVYHIDQSKNLFLDAWRSYKWDLALTEFPSPGYRSRDPAYRQDALRWSDRSPISIKQDLQAILESGEELPEPSGSAGNTIVTTRNTKGNGNPEEEIWIVDNGSFVAADDRPFSTGKRILVYTFDPNRRTIQLLAARCFEYDQRLAGNENFFIRNAGRRDAFPYDLVREWVEKRDNPEEDGGR